MRPERTVDYGLAVELAIEGRLTMGEIAHRVGWPKHRSLSSLVKYLEAKLPQRRRIRTVEGVGPATSQWTRRAG